MGKNWQHVSFFCFCNCFQRPQGTGATEDPFDGLHQPVLGHGGCGWFLQLCRKGQDTSPQVSVCLLACLHPIHPPVCLSVCLFIHLSVCSSICLSVHPSVWCHVCWGRRCKCGVQWGSLMLHCIGTYSYMAAFMICMWATWVIWIYSTCFSCPVVSICYLNESACSLRAKQNTTLPEIIL